MGLKWYDVNKLAELNENVISIQQELQTKVDAFQTIQTTLFCTWLECGSRVDVNIGEFASEVQNYMDISSKYQRKLNSIIHEHNDKIGTFSTSITNSNNICNSYFKKVDYILGNITEPHLMFVTPSGGWKNTMRDYNMTQIDLSNSDVDSITELWDSYYADYLEYCRINGENTTIDGFNAYMSKYHTFAYEKIMYIMMCKELDIDINDPNLSETDLIDELTKYLKDNKIKIDSSFSNLKDLLNLVSAIVSHKMTSASIASFETGIDSAVLFANAKYFVGDNGGIGTETTINVPKMSCKYDVVTTEYSERTGEPHSTTETKTMNYNSSDFPSKAAFNSKCSDIGGKIKYDVQIVNITVSENELEGKDGDGLIGSGIVGGQIQKKGISEIDNYIVAKNLEALENDKKIAESKLNNKNNEIKNAKDKLVSVLTQLSKEQAFELIGLLTKETPIVGNLLTVGEITLNLTMDQIKLVEEYKILRGECDQLNAQISTLNTLIEANINQKGSVVVIVNENYDEKNSTKVDYTNISVTVAGVNGGKK